MSVRVAHTGRQSRQERRVFTASKETKAATLNVSALAGKMRGKLTFFSVEERLVMGVHFGNSDLLLLPKNLPKLLLPGLPYFLQQVF